MATRYPLVNPIQSNPSLSLKTNKMASGTGIPKIVSDKKPILRNEGKFSCNPCEKKLATTTSLQYHLSCHSDSRQVPCKLCDLAFRTKASLKSHMKTHTKEKPYKCPDCDKTFAHLNSMKGHKSTHEGEKTLTVDLPKQVCNRSIIENPPNCSHPEKKHISVDNVTNHFHIPYP